MACLTSLVSADEALSWTPSPTVDRPQHAVYKMVALSSLLCAVGLALASALAVADRAQGVIALDGNLNGVQPTSKLCPPGMHFEQSGAQAVTIFGALHYQGEMRIGFVRTQLDDGVHLPTDAAPDEPLVLRSTGNGCTGQVPISSVTRGNVTNRVAGAQTFVSFGLNDDVARDCALEATWPSAGLRASISMCTFFPVAPEARASKVAVCLPLFVPPNIEVAAKLPGYLESWLNTLVPQVHDVFIVALSGAELVMNTSIASRSQVHLDSWNWFEATVAHGAIGMGPEAHHTQSYKGSSRELGQNPYTPQQWVLSKCLLELRASHEWLAVFDLDEMFAVADDAPHQMLGAYATQLRPDIHQHPLCAKTRNKVSLREWRPKSLTRLHGPCQYAGYPHVSMRLKAFTGDADFCNPRDLHGRDVLSHPCFAPEFDNIWSNFTCWCEALAAEGGHQTKECTDGEYHPANAPDYFVGHVKGVRDSCL